MRLPIALSAFLVGACGSALAKDCRIPDLPPGNEVKLPPGCQESLPASRSEAERQGSLKSSQGFIDLGNGTQVRIGGRVRAEMGFRR
ncbi:hypothetical protein GGR34_003832 [Microvirga flocculans]|uniref:Porin n=1 Tax=Microvirga flocculans TaxID=217168 RepID=A0A7W6IIL6_9HYPH|nr:hypothetical protein [Microvirga flocculans]MBB4042147.1 hypothetical protein [Microvirga flocculans]